MVAERVACETAAGLASSSIISVSGIFLLGGGDLRFQAGGELTAGGGIEATPVVAEDILDVFLGFPEDGF